MMIDWSQLFVVATVVVLVLSVLSLLRLTTYLVGSDIYTVRFARDGKRQGSDPYMPSFSLIVPMHNEGVVADRTLTHLMKLDYPNLQIIVADDGSTDDTVERIMSFKHKHDPNNVIEVVLGENGGKAHALNNAIRTQATGELIMCMDGDSYLAPDAVTKSVAYFRDPNVMGTASNVVIIPNGTLLGLVQRFEYVFGYEMKKAHNVFNSEYIIGGVGSTFRRDVLEEVGLYDTNTMTEDIDLTMKILAQVGNKYKHFAFAHDSIGYTEPVLSFPALVKQRYRWRYGWMQALLKHSQLFFSRDKKHAAGLSWFFLPYVTFLTMVCLFEPLIMGIIIGTAVYFHSLATLITTAVVVTGFLLINVMRTTHLSPKDKAGLLAVAPVMYVLLFMLMVVEVAALVGSLAKVHRLRSSLAEERVVWKSPARAR